MENVWGKFQSIWQYMMPCNMVQKDIIPPLTHKCSGAQNEKGTQSQTGEDVVKLEQPKVKKTLQETGPYRILLIWEKRHLPEVPKYQFLCKYQECTALIGSLVVGHKFTVSAWSGNFRSQIRRETSQKWGNYRAPVAVEECYRETSSTQIILVFHGKQYLLKINSSLKRSDKHHKHQKEWTTVREMDTSSGVNLSLKNQSNH